MAGRRKKHVADTEHVNHERWLITYADMITLLMVLFIVLFSMSQVDLAKFEQLKQSLNGAFGASSGGGSGASPIEGGDGVLPGSTVPIALPAVDAEAQAALATQEAQKVAAAAEQAVLEETKAKLGAALGRAGLGGAGIGMRVERRGLVVTIASDKVLFHPGQATLRPEGHDIIRQLARPLASMPNPLRVEGHTDDVPIAGSYASNWELSTARATTVLRELASAGGIAPARLSAAGYADQRPMAPNTTPDGRARNRRVEILVEANTPEGGS